MPGALAIGSATFHVEGPTNRSAEILAGGRVLAASVTKPLLFWAGAAFLADRNLWTTLAGPGITISDNAATGKLWSEVGGTRLLGWLAERTGVSWRVGAGREHPSLRLEVTAAGLACGYAALTSDRAQGAEDVRGFMRSVHEGQTFGLRPVVAAALGVEASRLG